MEANEVKPGTGDQGSQALEEFQRRHYDMGGAITIRGFELQDDVAFWCARQAFMAQGGQVDGTGSGKTCKKYHPSPLQGGISGSSQRLGVLNRGGTGHGRTSEFE